MKYGCVRFTKVIGAYTHLTYLGSMNWMLTDNQISRFKCVNYCVVTDTMVHFECVGG